MLISASICNKHNINRTLFTACTVYSITDILTHMYFNCLVIEAQILMEEDLINVTSIQFPTVTNTSDNDSLVFDNMTPMIEIPTSIILRQLEEGEC